MKLIVGISGATGVIYGVRLLQRLREAGVETHLVISKWGGRTLLHERVQRHGEEPREESQQHERDAAQRVRRRGW